MAKDTTPIEEFRRVTATTMRAVSRKEVNVSFVPDGGSPRGSDARLNAPPPRALRVEDVTRVRGEADSMALKLRHHDRKTHLRRVPRGETARAIFEAVEQVRVEALGAKRMAGVADNLSALWRQRSDQRGHARIKSKDDAPIADAICFCPPRSPASTSWPPRRQNRPRRWWTCGAPMWSPPPGATSRSCANRSPTRNRLPGPPASSSAT